MPKPTLQQAAEVYAQHLTPKGGLFIPDAVDLVKAAEIVHGPAWAKKLARKGWAIAAGTER